MGTEVIDRAEAVNNRAEAVNKGFGENISALDKVLVGFQGVKIPETPAAPAKMEEKAGVLGGITEMTVWDIPVGQAAVGGFVAVLASELIDGFLAKQSLMTRGVVKLAAAGAVVKWGGVLGNTGKKAVALLLAFDALRDIVPIDLWAQKAATAASGVVTQRGLVQGRDTSAVAQANQVVVDYYSRAERR